MKFLLFYFTLFLIKTLSQELGECIDLNKITYDKCNSKRNCNICSLSIFCGWCDSTQQCIPIDAETKTPVCNENCGRILELNQCFSIYAKHFSEEVDLKSNMYNKPQFLPMKYEQEYYSVKSKGEINNDYIKKSLLKDKIYKDFVKKEEGNGKDSSLKTAKNNIINFFDKLLKKQ